MVFHLFLSYFMHHFIFFILIFCIVSSFYRLFVETFHLFRINVVRSMDFLPLRCYNHPIAMISWNES